MSKLLLKAKKTVGATPLLTASKGNPKAFLTILLASALLIIGVVTLAAGNTYYVATTGNDGNACTTDQPCLSIDAAWDRCGVGDKVVVRSGTYTAQTITGHKSGWGCEVEGQTSGAGVKIGHLVTNAEYMTMRDIKIDVADVKSQGWTTGASHVLLERVDVLGGQPYVNLRGSTISDITWRQGVFGGKPGVIRECPNTEPFDITSGISNVTIEKITIWDQHRLPDGNDPNCGGQDNTFHMETFRIDQGAHDLTFKDLYLMDGDESNSPRFFVTEFPEGSGEPYNITWQNNYIGDSDNFAIGFRGGSMSQCNGMKVLYNTMMTDIDWGCGAITNSSIIGNAGITPSNSCPASSGTNTNTANVWQWAFATPANGFCPGNTWVKVAADTNAWNPKTGLKFDSAGHITDPSSPLVNAAEASCTTTLGNPARDRDGDARPSGAKCDAGADEYGAVSEPVGQTCDTITYTAPSGASNNITYTFNKAYPCGQFANGDWYVTPDSPGGTVVVTSISPAMTTGRHGVWVNPTAPNWNSIQRWDNRMQFYSAPTVSFPYTASGGQSVVKAVSRATPSSYSYIQFAAVLTVLDSVPSNPASTLRPPFTGTEKPLISTSSLSLSTLQRLDGSVAPNRINAATAASRTANFRLNYSPDPNHGYYIIPSDAVADGKTWGGDMYKADVESLLWMNMKDVCGSPPCSEAQDNAAKLPVVVDYIQHGIDIWGAANDSDGWFRGGGGNGAGALLPWVFAASLVNDTGLRSDLAALNPSDFWEMQAFYRGQNGVALWGIVPDSSPWEQTYWSELGQNSTGSKVWKDPYGYIDGGGIPGTSYQDNTSAQIQATALLMHIMPSFKAQWPTLRDNREVLYDYGYRWANTGTWTQPDPCAPKSGSYGVGYGPNGSGGCIAGSGRAPQLHGSNANGGNRNSAFVDEMWTAYSGGSTPSSRPADINEDGTINIFDLSILLSNYGRTISTWTNARADVNANGTVDIFDLSTLLSGFGT